MRRKVIVGMSGGVDSSVAAWLLLQEGYDVEGMFMKNWEQDDLDEYCPAQTDLNDALAVCDKLAIGLHTVNFTKEYYARVFEYFLDEYSKGRTPNPDVLCNKEIKFKAFFEHAISLGADYIATGHYARIHEKNGDYSLAKAKDRNKDQTYFLHAINPNILQKILFPIGDYLKSEIRNIAKELALPTHNKKDSTGICFIGERKFKAFLNEYLLSKPGKIITSQGMEIGTHDGLMFYTLGQRQGLKIGGIKGTNEEPWFVVDKDVAKNELIVAQGQHHPRLYANGLMCSQIHWLTKEIELPKTCYAKIRYRQDEFPVVISPIQENEHCIMFASPQRAVTPGQFIVFYRQNECIGGATINEIIR